MSSGKLVKQPGLLEKPGWFIQVMGEKLPLEIKPSFPSR
jgi:hypothetical protein